MGDAVRRRATAGNGSPRPVVPGDSPILDNDPQRADIDTDCRPRKVRKARRGA